MIKPWKLTGETLLGDYKIFSIHLLHRVSPTTGKEHQFTLLKCPDWVNVVALTEERQIVLVEQYRQGSDTIELEIPGGMIDPDDGDPIEAGIRELREETGYEGEDARIIGRVLPNPAFMSNSCYTVLVQNCKKIHPTQFDPTEDLATKLCSIDDIPGLIAGGKIRHSLVVAAFYYFNLWLQLRPATK
ncbi:MAG: NUDIX hydrolase [Verrucomicrobiia bacterium]|jgi:8-oxo-dGTP pyrophosphatase MutT (NUDIX family)